MKQEELEQEIYDSLNCKHAITKQFIKVLLEALKRFEKKQEVFDTNNIADNGEIGVFVRLGDFYSKIKKYLAVNEEKREELLLTEDKINKYYLDLGVFSFIALIFRKGNWK